MPAPLPRYLDHVPGTGSRFMGAVRFGGESALGDDGLTVALPPLAKNRFEIWESEAVAITERSGNLRLSHDGEYLIGMLADGDEDVERAARRAYDGIVRTVRSSGYPFLARIWNYVRGINEGEGDAERYKRFCAGRHDALTSHGFEKPDFPAASAVGMQAGSLAICFVAAKTPGTNVENPRQMSAYDYPRLYGSRSPSFARATIAHGAVYVSGTASVVGHATVHQESVEAQAEETIVNLERILAVCGAAADKVSAAKIYVRRAGDAAQVDARFAAAFPAAARLVVESDICRRDLRLEVEAVARLD